MRLGWRLSQRPRRSPGADSVGAADNQLAARDPCREIAGGGSELLLEARILGDEQGAAFLARFQDFIAHRGTLIHWNALASGAQRQQRHRNKQSREFGHRSQTIRLLEDYSERPLSRLTRAAMLCVNFELSTCAMRRRNT